MFRKNPKIVIVIRSTHPLERKILMSLILASASPRRKEILESHGVSIIIIPSNIEEILPEDRHFSPEETAMYLAEQKAIAIANNIIDGKCDAIFAEIDPCFDHTNSDNLKILAVDTIVYKDRIIEKPVDEADAIAILTHLKNSVHYVISGACIIELAKTVDTSGRQLAISKKTTLHDTTTVTFGDYSTDDIIQYIHENPPYDKSGSYAIQSSWSKNVKSREGSIENVIGLPWEAIKDLI